MVHIDNVGEVNLTRRKGSSRISVRVRPDGVVSVNLPWYATEHEVLVFIHKNIDWILKQQHLQKKQKQFFGINQEVSTRAHHLRIVAVEKGTVRAVRKDQSVVITIPVDVDVTDDRVQAFIRNVIIEMCRKDAKSYLPLRTAELAKLHGFSYQKVFLKSLKSKWGSCSSLGNINLNVHLMRLPDHLIDYIILHELVHTRHMNHGPQFWGLLDEVTNGKARQLDKEMKVQSKLILK